MNGKNQKLTFNPKQATKQLLGVLSDRARDVIVGRYGLGVDTKKMTLEAIGKKYGITRERVRQIENYSVQQIRKSKEYTKVKKFFDEMKDLVRSLGGIMAEQDLLQHLSPDKSTQNHAHFLLVVGEDFIKSKEDEEFNRIMIRNLLAYQFVEKCKSPPQSRRYDYI